MAEKYSPNMLGVTHTRRFLPVVLREIMASKAKTIGIESSEWELSRQELDRETSFFWPEIISLCKSLGIKVVYLTPDNLAKKMYSEMKKHAGREEETLANPEINNLFGALVKDVKTRKMAEVAKRERPDLIVVGLAHAFVMQKDLQIENRRFKMTRQRDPIHFLMTERLRTQHVQGVEDFWKQREIRKANRRR